MRCALPWLPAGLHAQNRLWLRDEQRDVMLVRAGACSVNLEPGPSALETVAW